MNTQVEPPRVMPFSTRESQWGWAIVVLANLPVPLIFGFLLTSEGGIFGMLAGIVAVWGLGHIVVARVPRVRSVLVNGGGVFALSQVIPAVQFVAGELALRACGTPINGWMSETTGFCVTLLTGGQLVTAALVCGLFLRVCGPFLGRLLAGHPSRDPS